MKLKLIAASIMLLSGIAVAAANADKAPEASFVSAASTPLVHIAFKPVGSISHDDALIAATGGAFKGELPSYENDGNENTTTRAGLRVRKSSVIVALQHHLGIDVAGRLTDPAKFISAVNKLVPADKALQASDLTNLEMVVVGMQSATTDVLTDIVPNSINNPVINAKVNFTLIAKAGETLGSSKASQLVIGGETPVKLSDYRRVDESTMKTTTTPVKIAIEGKKPAQVTYDSLAKALDGYFDITSDHFTTSLFPIWNVDPATDKPMFTNQSGEPVKHSLQKHQIDTLAAMYTGLDGKGAGDFGKARIERAVQKVVFTPAAGEKADANIKDNKGVYAAKYDVTITFIQHWSWNKAAYTEREADFTLKGVPVQVSFKSK